MTINTELLKKTLAHIEAHPSEWTQERWITKTDCGTSYCFAGWALTLAQVPIETCKDEAVVRVELVNAVLPEGEMPFERWDEFLTVRDAAEALLGLEDLELRDKEDGELYSAADVLFEADNELCDLREYIAALCAETAEAS